MIRVEFETYSKRTTSVSNYPHSPNLLEKILIFFTINLYLLDGFLDWFLVFLSLGSMPLFEGVISNFSWDILVEGVVLLVE